MDLKKISTFIIFTCSIGLIFELGYLRNTFYIPMCITLNLTNEEFGWLSSMYSIGAAITYFVGGVLSDRIHSRFSLALPLFLTGILGFLFSTIPNYSILKILFFFMGIVNIMTLFSFIIKVFYNFGTTYGYGKIFGAMESGKGIVGGMIFLLMASLFNGLGGGEFGFKWIIIAYSIIDIILGIGIILIVPDEFIYMKGKVKINFFKQIMLIIRNNQIWFLSIMVFMAYSLYGILSFFPSLFIENFNISTDKSVFFSITRYMVQILAPISIGIFSDKIKSSYKSMLISFLFCLLLEILLLRSIGKDYVYYYILLIYFCLTFFIYGMKGLYYSIISEVSVNKNFIGTTIGIIACIGFSSDLFIYKMLGMWIDRGVYGYKKLMEYMIILCIIGIFVTVVVLILKKINKNFCNNFKL